MPEETDDSPQPPEQPTLLGNLAPDEMFARGMQSVKMTSGKAGDWDPPTVEEARRLFPNYTVISLLGRGGMGAVYKAKQTALDRLVAIKLLPLEISVDQDFADRFVREARAMAKLHHPNIITVFDFGTTSEGHLYFAMEYVEGANLADMIHQVGLEPGQALSIVEQICTALGYAHSKGIVHRDIKPANVMVDTEGQVKVADFGLARLTDPGAEQMGHTMTGTVMGTPDYMAPEQMKGMNVDHRADIYSLGVMVYEMLCREVPRGIFQPPSVRTGCDTRIDEIVVKAMQQAPDHRYQSTQEMKTDVVTARSAVVAPEAGDAVSGAGAALPPPRRPSPPSPPKPPGPPSPDPASGGQPVGQPATTQVDSPPPPPPAETVVMPAIRPPAPRKSKLPLYAGIAAVVILVLGTIYVLVPKLQLGHAPGLGSFASSTPHGEAGASPAGALPSRSLATRDLKVGDDKASPSSALLAAATKDAPFVNTLGMKFVPVPIVSGPTAGQPVLFSVWDTRVQDYAAYAGAKKVDEAWTKANKDGVPIGRELNHPVVTVTWDEARGFCQWLTEKEIAEGRLPKGLKYRLPTDEEWSWAVGLPPELGTTPAEKSGKNSVDFPWGKDYPPRQKVGNYADEAFHAKFPPKKNEKESRMDDQWIEGYTDGYATTSPVGSFPANTYGLYDMGGNVWQWCEDWFDASHRDRVLRGASWDGVGRYYVLSSNRSHGAPGGRSGDYGFRCVIAPAPAEPPAVAGAPVPAVSRTPTTATKDAPFENTLGMKFVPVPILGGPTGGQRVLFSVWDARVQDYATYAGAKRVDDSWTNQEKDGVPAGRELNHPVVGVSWEDAQGFCQWLTEKERAEGKLPKEMQYRLPTDEEWSWAVGMPLELGATPAEKIGKNTVDYPWGKDYPPAKKVGNYGDESFHARFPPKKEADAGTDNGRIEGYDDGYATTSPVGSFPANAYGLYDMGGNVWQWCEDWFDASHKLRVLRGSSWSNYGRYNLLSSGRIRNPPTNRLNNYGFRCVLAPAVSVPPATPDQAADRTPAPATRETPAAAAGFPPSSEQWEDMLHGPDGKLELIGGARKSPDGLLLPAGGAVQFRTAEERRDGAIRVRAKFDDRVVDLHVRSTEEGSNYYLRFALGKAPSLKRWEASTKREISIRNFPLADPPAPGKTHELELRVVGQTLTARLDSAVLGTATDATLATGRFSMSFMANDGPALLVESLEFLDLDLPASPQPAK